MPLRSKSERSLRSSRNNFPDEFGMPVVCDVSVGSCGMARTEEGMRLHGRAGAGGGMCAARWYTAGTRCNANALRTQCRDLMEQVYFSKITIGEARIESDVDLHGSGVRATTPGYRTDSCEKYAREVP